MDKTLNEPTPRRGISWFNPLGRSLEGLAFILNRITGLGLTLYLFLHLIMLGNLARGADAYDNFIALVHHPLFVFGEFLVVAAGFIHGLNGLRIALTSLGFAVPHQRTMLVILLAISAIASVIFAIRMFTV